MPIEGLCLNNMKVSPTIGNPMEPGGRVPLHGGFAHLYAQCTNHPMISVTQHRLGYETRKLSIISSELVGESDCNLAFGWCAILQSLAAIKKERCHAWHCQFRVVGFFYYRQAPFSVDSELYYLRAGGLESSGDYELCKFRCNFKFARARAIQFSSLLRASAPFPRRSEGDIANKEQGGSFSYDFWPLRQAPENMEKDPVHNNLHNPIASVSPWYSLNAEYIGKQGKSNQIKSNNKKKSDTHGLII